MIAHELESLLLNADQVAHYSVEDSLGTCLLFTGEKIDWLNCFINAETFLEGNVRLHDCK